MSEYGIRVSEWDLVCGRRDATNKLVICGDQELFVEHAEVPLRKCVLGLALLPLQYCDAQE